MLRVSVDQRTGKGSAPAAVHAVGLARAPGEGAETTTCDIVSPWQHRCNVGAVTSAPGSGAGPGTGGTCGSPVAHSARRIRGGRQAGAAEPSASPLGRHCLRRSTGHALTPCHVSGVGRGTAFSNTRSSCRPTTRRLWISATGCPHTRGLRHRPAHRGRKASPRSTSPARWPTRSCSRTRHSSGASITTTQGQYLAPDQVPEPEYNGAAWNISARPPVAARGIPPRPTPSSTAACGFAAGPQTACRLPPCPRRPRRGRDDQRSSRPNRERDPVRQ